MRPPVPQELLEVKEILPNDKYIKFVKTKDERDTFFQDVVGPPGHRSIVCGSRRVANWYSGLKAGVDGLYVLTTSLSYVIIVCIILFHMLMWTSGQIMSNIHFLTVAIYCVK